MSIVGMTDIKCFKVEQFLAVTKDFAGIVAMETSESPY